MSNMSYSPRRAKAAARAAIEKARAASKAPAAGVWGEVFNREGRRVRVFIPANVKRHGR